MSRAECLVLFAAGIFAFPPAALAGFINAVWTGGDSSSVWTGALNWNPNGIPNNGSNTFSVLIASTAYNPVTLGTNTTINQLIMAATTSLSLSPSVTLNLVSGTSSLTNAQLTGGGSLVVGDTLQGSGYVAPSALTNSGSIIANQSAPLYLAPGSLTNSGLMTATANAVLILAAGNITNTGGTISANGANSFVGIFPTSPSATLTGGTVEVVNGGTMMLEGAAQSATLNAGAGSILNLNGAQVTGGAVNVSATGTLNLGGSNPSIISTLSNYGAIAVDAASTMGGTMTNYSGGVINVANGIALSVQAGGAYTNYGAINLNSATLKLAGSGTVSLSGSGTLNMNGSGSGIFPTAAGQTFDNGAGHTIQGSGTIEPYALTNEGSIIANTQSSLLLVTPPSSVTNSGLMTATGGAGMIFQTGNIANTGGTINANGVNSRVAVVYPSTTLTGGTVEAVNGGTLQLDSVTQGATLNAGANSYLTMIGAQVTGGAVNVNATGTLNLWTSPSSINSTLSNYGAIVVDAATTVGGAMTNYSGGLISVNGSSLSLQAGGAYTNNGLIILNSAALELAGSGTVSLSGSGTLNLNGSGSSIVSTAAGQTFDNGAGHTIQGSGTIEPSSALTNEGTIIAAGSALLTIDSTLIANNGTFDVEAGSGLALGSSPFSNYSSNTLTGGTYDIAGFFEFQGADIVTNQANLDLSGSSWDIANQNGQNGTRDLAENGANGSFDLQNGAVFSTSQQFTNEGDVTIGPGSAFGALASGSSAYLQTAGTTLVDGTLVGNVDLEGGSLSGSGEVEGNVYNTVAMDPGDAPGTLLISGNYTQTAGAVLNIELLNAVVYDKLQVSGNAQLGGTLDVTLLPGYVLNSGDVFTILMANSVSGTFSSWDLPVLANTYWTYAVNGNDVQLEFHTPEPATWSTLAAGALLLWWRKRNARNAP